MNNNNNFRDVRDANNNTSNYTTGSSRNVRCEDNTRNSTSRNTTSRTSNTNTTSRNNTSNTNRNNFRNIEDLDNNY